MSLVQDILPLRSQTPSQPWLDAVFADFPSFLQDHAACERKAAASAMAFVSKYPDREALMEPMICLAKEEWAHFHEIYRIMHRRGIPLRNEEKDIYVVSLIKNARHPREQLLMDRLLIAGLIEARSCERFLLLAACDRWDNEPELGELYRRLAREEAGHYRVFLRLAKLLFKDNELEARWDELLDIEAKAIEEAPLRATVH